MVNKISHFGAKLSTSLLKPAMKNAVFLNCWSPGYKVTKKIKDFNGVEKSQKIFVPTGTFEAAIAHLKNEYGTKEYLKFKEDAHPGHVSVETRNAYLSVGTEDSMTLVGVQTQHPIYFTDSFDMDLLGFLRVPEMVLDFYTLDCSLVEKAINELKSSQFFYSLLGKRLFKNEGESCATSAFLALEAGGIENLLNVNQWLLTKHGVLTPSLLSSYSAKARAQEQTSFSDSIIFSSEVLTQKQHYAEQLLSNYKKDRQIPADIPEEFNKRGPSK